MLGKALRYKFAGAGAVLVVLGLVGASATAGASVPRTTPTPVAFTGSITCTVTGRLLSNPPLTMVSQKTILTLNATLTGCTGNTTEKRVTITRGVLNASTTLTASCMSLQTSKGLAPSGTIHWGSKNGLVTPTKLSFSSGTSSISTGNGAITVSLPGTGKAVTTGSFPGTTSKATIVFDQSWSSLAGQCLFPIGGGVSLLSFSGVLGPSAASIG
jgi:hypothetical protein